MDCPCLSPQRRFHPASVLSLLRCHRSAGARFVKALIDRRAAVESDVAGCQRRREDVPDFRQADLPGAGS